MPRPNKTVLLLENLKRLPLEVSGQSSGWKVMCLELWQHGLGPQLQVQSSPRVQGIRPTILPLSLSLKLPASLHVSPTLCLAVSLSPRFQIAGLQEALPHQSQEDPVLLDDRRRKLGLRVT